MEWFYAKDNKQHGPVTPHQLTELSASGQISGDTLVWREGMSGWQKYRTTLPPPVPMAGDGRHCTNCRRAFPESDLVRYGDQWVCASCKPAFFQRLKETGTTNCGDVWRSGDVLVMNRDASLPDRCVKCNQPAGGFRLKRKLFYHHPGVYLVILINLLIYAIVASIVGKRATIHVGLCEVHRRKRWQGIAIGWGSFFGGLFIAIVGGMNATDPGLIILGGILLLVIGGITGIVISNVVSAKKIEPECLQIKGVCREYLDTFPEWHGR